MDKKKLAGLLAGAAFAAVATVIGVKTTKAKKGEVIAEEISEVEEVSEEL